MSLFFFVTNLSKNEILSLTGYGQINELLKERSDAIKEILIKRKFAPVTKIRSAKIFSMDSNLQSVFGEKHSQVMFAIKHGINLKSIASFTVESQRKVFAKVNAMHSYGEMSDETRQRYIADLDNEFADDLVNLYESTK